MQQLIKYAAACRAVSEAKSIDEVKEITNRAEALRAYARQAKNRQLEIDAVEIRVRAERRGGEILLDLRKEGQIGQGRGGRPIKLADLGVDSNLSGGMQRLAKLTPNTFEREMSDWREAAPTAIRLEVPLQRFRKPSIRGDHQRAAAKRGRITISSDQLSRFVAPDGRKMADWRDGELGRQRQLAARVIRCVDALTAERPVANPDPLDTMEMIWRDSAKLAAVLSSAWDAEPVSPGATGVDDVRIATSRESRSRTCAGCNSAFIMKRAPHKDRPTEGQFCSRKCAATHQKKKKH